MKCSLLCLIVLLSHCWGEMNLQNYVITWDQDFTKMYQLNVTAWGPGSTWIAHTPYGGDWVNFMNPQGPYLPFNVGNGMMTIRSQNHSGTMYGGLVSSVDPHGLGFSQKYGYFEMSAQLPKGPGTWPAFWLLDVPSLVDRSLNSHEIDILEQYGTAMHELHSTLHFWSHNSSNTWGQEKISLQCQMTTGFHTYGLDIQSDYLTFYFDRLAFWQTPNIIPTSTEIYDRPFYVLVNLAYGSGNNSPTGSNFVQDMLVKYVRVWEGSGGSASAFSTATSNAITWATSGISLTKGQQVNILNTNLIFNNTGNLQITDSCGNILWRTQILKNCSSGCSAVFQNDGNLVLYNGGSPYWSSETYNNNVGSMEFSNQPPYLKIMDENCNVLWTTKVNVSACTPIPAPHITPTPTITTPNTTSTPTPTPNTTSIPTPTIPTTPNTTSTPTITTPNTTSTPTTPHTPSITPSTSPSANSGLNVLSFSEILFAIIITVLWII